MRQRRAHDSADALGGLAASTPWLQVRVGYMYTLRQYCCGLCEGHYLYSLFSRRPHSSELASMNYQDFSFCKPYLQVVRAALQRDGRAPSIPEDAIAPTRPKVVKSRRKRMLGTPHSAAEGHDEEHTGKRPRDQRSSDDAPRRVVTRRIKVCSSYE